MKIIISGSSGLIGTALVRDLIRTGDEVRRFVRRNPRRAEGEIFWNPETFKLDRSQLEGLDAMVHLAGENIAQGRWTAAKKQRIYQSRVIGTRLVAEALAKLDRPPAAMICASAVGYYGDRTDEVLTEQSPAGSGFLARTCRDWEAAAAPAREAGVRVVHVRIGIVLSPKGGALRMMLPLFRKGLGGRLGAGRQYMSWVTAGDLVRIVAFLLHEESLSGAVNAVAPNPVTNRQFARSLGKVLRRPAIAPVPRLVLRLLLGKAADELLFASTRVHPTRLLAAGFAYQHEELEPALRHLLAAPASPPGSQF